LSAAGRLRRHLSDGWRLGGAALRFALANRVLQRFLLISACIVLVISAGVAAAAVLVRNHTGPIGYVLAGLAAYYCLSVMTTAVAVGMAGLVADSLDSRPVTLADGWRLIVRRRRPILGWSVVDLAVGVPSRYVGSVTVNWLVVLLLGFGWGLVSFFAIPTIALTGASPLVAARHSLRLVRRQWQDAAYGLVYVWVRAAVWFGVPGVVAVAAGVLLIRGGVTFAGGVLFVIGVACLAVGFLVAQAARAVLTVMLYRYAESGTVHPGFPAELLARSVRPASDLITRLAARIEGDRLRRFRGRVLGDLEDPPP
jgi:Family of unknown function (DUF6159)